VLKALERFGRNLLLKFLNRHRLPQTTPAVNPSSILVIRTDPRIGNVIMLTAFLKELQHAFPESELTLLGPAKAKILLTDAPTLSALWSFNKKNVLGDDGWLATLRRLRGTHFDLIIDASNPTSPSTTQTLLTLSGRAPQTLSFGRSGETSAYTLTAEPLPPQTHENLQRVQLLKPLGYTTAAPQLPDLGYLAQRPSPSIDAWLEKSALKEFVVINIGARLQEKQLEASDYYEVIQALEMLNLRVVLTYGPSALPLAEQSAQNTSAKLAPKTDLLELAALFHHARAVITCDTGPMHLAVALGTPTCGIFVSTPPERYGYQEKGHTCVDARNGFNAEAQGLVSNWCGKILRG